MTGMLATLLLRLSEVEYPVLWGRVAAPHFGREFDRLLAQRILVEESPEETWGLCSDCECGFEARPIQRINGRLLAVCPLDHQADTPLTDTDIRSFRIDPAVLVREIATASGFVGSPAEIMPGVWRLGTVMGARAVFVALAVTAIVQPALMGMLTKSARGMPITLLVPKHLPEATSRQLDDAGVYVVAVLDALSPDPKAPFAFQPNMLVPVLAPKLRLIKSRFGVVLSGTEGTLPKRPFDLLWVLAEAGGAIVERRNIERQLWTQPAEKTKVNDAIRDLRAALKVIDQDGDALIETKAGQGYRVVLDASEIALS